MIFFCDAQFGLDANDGLSSATPKLTLSAAFTLLNGVAAQADTLYLSGTFYADASNSYTPQTATMTSLSNKTVTAWPANNNGSAWSLPLGMTAPSQPILFGGSQIGSGFASIGGTKYTITLAAFLAVSSVAFKYESSTTATGHHYGILRNNIGAANLGEFSYNLGTGVLTINVPSAPTVDADVVICCVDSTLAAIKVASSSSCSFSDLHFKFWPATTGQFGWGICVNPGTSISITSCKFWDMGFHSAGTLGGGACSNCTIDACTLYSCQYNGGHTVHYQDNASGNMTGSRVTDSVIHLRRYLGYQGTSGTEATAVTAGQSANIQLGSYTHSDSGTTITDTLFSGNTYIEYEPGSTAFGCANVPTPSDAWDWTTFGARADLCTIQGGNGQTGASSLSHTNHIAIRRCTIDMRNAGPSLLSSLATNGAMQQTGTGKITLYDSCSVIATINDGANNNNDGLFATVGSASEIRFINSSVHCSDTDTSLGFGRALCAYLSNTNTYFRARGSVFSFNNNYVQNIVCLQDSTSTAAHHDFIDCIYAIGATGRWSENVSFNTAANWFANVDTSGTAGVNNVSTTPFPSAPSDLSLDATSSIWNLFRSTSAIVPSATGINDRGYGGNFGAYQYPTGSLNTFGRSSRKGSYRARRSFRS